MATIKNKKTEAAGVQALHTGVAKHFQNTPNLGLRRATFTPAEVEQLLQGFLDSMTGVGCGPSHVPGEAEGIQ